MSNTITQTNYNFPKQTKVYKGKVRDVYFFENKQIALIASDRISAFDAVLPKGIPYKGEILTSIAAKFLNETKDIVPNWLLATPDPNVAIGLECEPFMVEMVIRGYLAGHSWREYKAGKRIICGVPMPEGMKENEKFPTPIITPATKAEAGEHDEDISREDIIARGIVSKEDYQVLEKYTFDLFERGTQIADKQDLILVDTKYEFGKKDGIIYLIDEIHTPDSSRYFYKNGYQERQDKDEPQKQLSKEFVREWLIENGFQGLEGQEIPAIPDSFVETITERYIELYEKITGEVFVKNENSNIEKRIENNITNYFSSN